MNTVLWILQILLALAFLGAGAAKLTRSREQLRTQMGWVEDFDDRQVKGIGGLEVLGALGVVLPWALGIAKVLTPLAATGLAITMVGAVVVHQRRREVPLAVPALVLLVLSVVVAVGRFGDL